MTESLALLTLKPSVIHVLSDFSMLAFGESNPENFKVGMMLPRVYTPHKSETQWTLVWYEMRWGRLRSEEKTDGWLYAQMSKRVLTESEAIYCQQLLDAHMSLNRPELPAANGATPPATSE